MSEKSTRTFYGNSEIAAMVGMNCAFIFERVRYWSVENRKRGVNECDGRYWFCCSLPSWNRVFPFMSISTIRRSISKLRDIGWIDARALANRAMDRTYYYTLAPAGIAICRDLSLPVPEPSGPQHPVPPQATVPLSEAPQTASASPSPTLSTTPDPAAAYLEYLKTMHSYDYDPPAMF